MSTGKRILFIRHGLTEMNERLQIMPWYSENFEDGALYDTRLSETGVLQAKELHSSLQTTHKQDYELGKIELILASPLTRTLHTADLVFDPWSNLVPANVPRISHPLLRERVYLSSEVGRMKNELQTEYPHWDFSAVPADKPWWYVYNRNINPHGNNTLSTADSTKGSQLNMTLEEDKQSGSHEHDRLRSYITDMQTAAMFTFATTEEITSPPPVSFYDSYATTDTSTETAEVANDKKMRELNSELYLSNANRSNSENAANTNSVDSSGSISSVNSIVHANNSCSYGSIPSVGDSDDTEGECQNEPYIEWRPAGKYCCEGEPNTVFAARIKVLRKWLLDRPENYIAVVTHWGVLKALTGREFGNCEVQVVGSEELLSVPDVVDT